MSKEPAEHPGSDPTPEDALINAAFEQVSAGGRGTLTGGIQDGLEARGPDKPLADSIPGYEILREIHRGGQGVVYQAIQKSTKRRVAVKVMREGPFAGKSDRARFEREVEVLGQLNHPNIVNVHDSGEAAGCFYFVMDYISGQPLDAWLTSSAPTVEEVLRLFRKICEAVHAAHLKGVIHRDLKPGNIRIDDAGEPHVLDFGLAKLAYGVEEASQMTATGQFVGSLPWASPEQAEARPGKIDLRTDVYSLGVILYQMLTGRFPYDVIGNMRDVLDRIMRAEPARPSTVASAPRGRRGGVASAPRGGRTAAGSAPRVVSRAHRINDEVDTIVLKCLSKERERRYQSAGELARDIGRYLGGEAIEAKGDSGWYVVKKQLRRHVTFVTAVAGYLLVVTVAFATSFSFWRTAARMQVDLDAALRSTAQERDHARESATSALAAKTAEQERREQLQHQVSISASTMETLHVALQGLVQERTLNAATATSLEYRNHAKAVIDQVVALSAMQHIECPTPITPASRARLIECLARRRRGETDFDVWRRHYTPEGYTQSIREATGDSDGNEWVALRPEHVATLNTAIPPDSWRPIVVEGRSPACGLPDSDPEEDLLVALTDAVRRIAEISPKKDHRYRQIDDQRDNGGEITVWTYREVGKASILSHTRVTDFVATADMMALWLKQGTDSSKPGCLIGFDFLFAVRNNISLQDLVRVLAEAGIEAQISLPVDVDRLGLRAEITDNFGIAVFRFD